MDDPKNENQSSPENSPADPPGQDEEPVFRPPIMEDNVRGSDVPDRKPRGGSEDG